MGRFVERLDRGNPLRGRSPRAVFFITLYSYALLLAALALVARNDATQLIGGFAGYSVLWFFWVWRA